MDEFKREFKEIQQKMKAFDKEYKKKLLFLAFINKYLKKAKSNLIILGGFAVEFYTIGEYSSKDIDLACNNRKALENVLMQLGFEKIGRHYYLDKLDLAIEIPTSSLPKNIEERLITVELEGYDVPMIGIDDIIIDRLSAFSHWQSLEDGRIAKLLLHIHFKNIDWVYLEAQAQEERLSSELKTMKDEIIRERETYED